MPLLGTLLSLPQQCSKGRLHRDPQPTWVVTLGFDHGVGHSLLLLYDAKTPHGQEVNYFKCLGHDPSNISIGLLYIIIKYAICITI
jgi:hypothetical protein